MTATPLMLMTAVIRGHAEMVAFLITRKANVNLAEPCNGYTSLHFSFRPISPAPHAAPHPPIPTSR